jgi:hypothetical protein
MYKNIKKKYGKNVFKDKNHENENSLDDILSNLEENN